MKQKNMTITQQLASEAPTEVDTVNAFVGQYFAATPELVQRLNRVSRTTNFAKRDIYEAGARMWLAAFERGEIEVDGSLTAARRSEAHRKK